MAELCKMQEESRRENGTMVALAARLVKLAKRFDE